MDTLTLIRPDDWHLHLRDGQALQAVVAATADQFGRAIIMPNLKPPVTTVAQAIAYRQRILAALATVATASPDADPATGNASGGGASAAARTAARASFTPLMTLYLTDRTEPAEIQAAADSGLVHAVKLYPAGATTNSDAGVTDLRKVAPALERMQAVGMPLLVHGEVTDPDVDLFDREARFIEQVMIPLRQRYPALKVVFEHITTREAAEYVREASGPIGATITAHHLLYNRNAIFLGGVRPHWYCLPVLKRETHRLALLEAAISGNPRFFLGTDSAPHPQRLKEHAAACAGCYTAPHAIELYATAFDMAGALDKLEGFASFYGPDFYGLPRNTERVSLRRESWTIPESLPFGDDRIVPLAGGETLNWRLAAV